MTYPKPGYYLAIGNTNTNVVGVYRVPSKGSNNWYLRWIHNGPMFPLLYSKRLLRQAHASPIAWYKSVISVYYTSVPIARDKAKLLIKLSDQPEFRRV